jgi:dTDP-4-dehydrorhamnose reductase
MLGTALQTVLSERGVGFSAPAERDFDITDKDRVRKVVGEFAASGGEVLVNAAAYTDVERAEDDERTAYRVNEDGARLLAEAARDAGLRFVHVSTDFVFDGMKTSPYIEDDAPNPLSVYGASKLAGERAVAGASHTALIVRTAWVFGPAGRNFPVKILELAQERESLSVVTDEVGSPTYTMDLAVGILGLIDRGAVGLAHLAGRGSCSRYEMAEKVLELAGIECRLETARAKDYPSKVRRPANSVLNCAKARSMGVMMPRWEDALGRFIRDDVEW